MKKHTLYHSFLRISSVVFALLLLFESGLINDSTRIIAVNTHHYLANVIGASATVTPTELNQVTAALTTQRTELDAREAALKEREIQVNLATNGNSNDTATYVLASILFVLLVLILLNYTLDYLRMKDNERVVGV